MVLATASAHAADAPGTNANEKAADKPAKVAAPATKTAAPAATKPSQPKAAGAGTGKGAAPAKKGAPASKPSAIKTSRTSRIPDAASRRQVAGGPISDDTQAGAESPELAALREAERELFPENVPLSDPFSVVPGASTSTTGSSALSADGKLLPRVQATGLPRISSKRGPGAEGGKDLSWMSGLVLPELPIRWEPRLVRYLEFFKDDPRGRATLSVWLRRSGRYADLVKKTLRKKGVPEDLVWLSMIESGFDPTIRSPAGALGCWQFMNETGRQYGLHQDRWLDQRMNVQASTEAAAEFLGDLHKRFGSWELAMASYNMGYAGLLMVVRKYNTNDYWALSELEGALPWETTLYVPKILAAAIVAKNLAKFGFGDLTIEPSLDADEIFVPPATSLASIAKAAGVPTKDIETLNPELRASRTPPLGDDDPKGATFSVKIPPGKSPIVLANLPKIKHDEKPLERYVVKFGESLDQIAGAHGTSSSKLSELNAIAPGELVRGGTVLLVPRPESTALASAGKAGSGSTSASTGSSGGSPASATSGEVASGDAAGTDPSGKPVVVVPADVFVYPDKKRVFYRVTAGDSLRDVSSAFAVSVDEIRRWNGLDPQGRLHEGMTLQLFVAPDTDLSKVVSMSEQDVRPLVVGSEEFFTYFEGQKGRKRVVLMAKAGDTFESIGRRYGLSAASMERINRRGRNETLKEGDRVVVYVSTESNGKSATAAKSVPAADVADPTSCPYPGVTGPEPLGPLPSAPLPDRLPKSK